MNIIHNKNIFFLPNLSAQAQEGISSIKLTIQLKIIKNRADQNEKFRKLVKKKVQMGVVNTQAPKKLTI
jgi:hypothetical protein